MTHVTAYGTGHMAPAIEEGIELYVKNTGKMPGEIRITREQLMRLKMEASLSMKACEYKGYCYREIPIRVY